MTRQPLHITLATLPRAAWALFAGAFVNRFGSFVVPFLTLYLTRGGYGVAQTGLVVSAYGVGSLAAAAAGGSLADQLGRRATIALSMFASAATMLLLWRAAALPLVAVLTGLAGLSGELYRPATGALIADLVAPESRVTGFALYRLAINSGVAIGTTAAGFLADRSFAWLFVGDAATSAVFGIVALLAFAHIPPQRARRVPPGPGDAPRSRPRGDERDYGFLAALARDQGFILFLVASTLGAFAYFQSLSTLGLQVRAYHLPNAAYGGLLGLNGALVLVVELPLTALTQRLPAPLAMAAGEALTGLGFGLVAVARTLPLLGLTVLLWTLGEIVSSPVAAAYVANRAPAHLRGRYQGASGLAWAVGLILAPALGTRLFAWSPMGLWLLCAALGVVAALLMLFGSSAPVARGDAADAARWPSRRGMERSLDEHPGDQTER